MGRAVTYGIRTHVTGFKVQGDNLYTNATSAVSAILKHYIVKLNLNPRRIAP